MDDRACYQYLNKMCKFEKVLYVDTCVSEINIQDEKFTNIVLKIFINNKIMYMY